MTMRPAFLGTVALLLGGALGCGGSPSGSDAGPLVQDGGPNDDGGTIAAQMNDVSILFPMATDGGVTRAGLLAASASGARGTLLPSNLYDAVGHVIGNTFTPPISPGSTGEAKYGDLALVAVRIDPCFASLDPDPHGTGCANQLRLIFQEMVLLNNGIDGPNDSALHVFYSLTRAELESLVRSVIALRQASSGSAQLGALQPHPDMVKEGLNGPFATGLRALILNYAGARNLVRVTKMSANDSVFAWTFSGFDVTNASAASITPMVIPTLLPDAGSSQTFVRNFGGNEGMQGRFDPETISPDDLAPLSNADVANGLDAGTRQSVFDALVRVENPTRFTPNTIDCASCHLAMPTALYNAGPLFGLSEAGNANAFAADARFVPAGAMVPTLDVTGAFNLHAFSYAGAANPEISQRTVNESAAIVAYLNTLQ
jgi:hypothetical protein